MNEPMGFVEALSDVWKRLTADSFAFQPGVPSTLGRELSAPQDDPYARSYDEIVSIQQKGSKGFRTLDIDPYNLDRATYYPLISEDLLSDIIGTETNAVPQGYVSESEHLPFWRTVALPLNANWLRVEYLPSGQNDLITFEGNLQDETAYPANCTPDFIVKYASSRIILLNFEDTTTAPIIVKPGETFEVPFNTAYLTFKTWSPKIRVTVGYNAKIVDQSQPIISPAYGPGHGIFPNHYLHSVPFSITHEDVGASIQTTSGTPTVVEELIVNTTATTNPNNSGVLVGWLTSLSYGISASAASVVSSANVEGRIDLCVAEYPSFTPIRRLASLPLIANNAFAPSAGPTLVADRESKNFTEPVRFSLHTNECLIARFTSATSPFTTTHRFSVEGYTFGNLAGTGVGSDFAPFYPEFKLTQEAYPLDRNTTGAPR